MARPRIVKETKRAINELQPPSDGIRPHPWLSAESLAAYKKAERSKKPFRLYISSVAERKIREHALGEAPRRLEVMGFMLGEVASWHKSTYSVVRDVATTELRSSASKVRFDPNAFPKLFVGLDGSGFDYVLVGWYHSHPGHTCFLSRTDLETQRSMFREAYHSALVVDPINEDVKAFRLSGDGYEEIQFAVFDHTTPGRPARKRRLKVEPAIGR